MSYEHGRAAICNQASDRIPRTEYGVEGNKALFHQQMYRKYSRR